MNRRPGGRSTSADDPGARSLVETAARIRDGVETSESVVRATLDRIAGLDDELHAFLLVTADAALAQAREADAEIAAGHWRGPLHGIPIALKDSIGMAGYPTTAGMEFLRDAPTAADATVVTRLRDAGAVIIGKTHMTDGATVTHHPAFPRPVNPWGRDLWTGASSSGSGVAVAAGFCLAALGTDTSGSIRLPAAANNLTGIKPTSGLVSYAGIMAMSPTFETVGPMAGDVADAAAVLSAIAGPDPADPITLGNGSAPRYDTSGDDLAGLVVGIDGSSTTDGVEDVVVDALRRTIEVLSGLGAEVREVEIPRLEEEIATASIVILAEAGVSHADHFPAMAERYGPGPLGMLRAAAALDARTVTHGYLALQRVRARMRTLVDAVDVLLLPVSPRRLPTWDAMQPPSGTLADAAEAIAPLLRFTHPVNAAGLPAIAFPAGFVDDALPLALQVVARPFDEATAIRTVAAFQRGTDYHRRRPPFP